MALMVQHTALYRDTTTPETIPPTGCVCRRIEEAAPSLRDNDRYRCRASGTGFDPLPYQQVGTSHRNVHMYIPRTHKMLRLLLHRFFNQQPSQLSLPPAVSNGAGGAPKGDALMAVEGWL